MEIDEVNHPPHYTRGTVECIDAIRAALGPLEFAGFLRGTVMQYLWRDGAKAPGTQLTDRQKAAWYLARFVELIQ